MAVFDILLPKLLKQFPEARARVESGDPPRVTIPAVHPRVGDLVLQDDGHEITAYVGHFTHSHFSNYDDIPVSDKEQLIAEDVMQFLGLLFSNRVIMWGSHESGGGWRSISYDDAPRRDSNEYVWSGPLNT